MPDAFSWSSGTFSLLNPSLSFAVSSWESMTTYYGLGTKNMREEEGEGRRDEQRLDSLFESFLLGLCFVFMT